LRGVGEGGAYYPALPPWDAKGARSEATGRRGVSNSGCVTLLSAFYIAIPSAAHLFFLSLIAFLALSLISNNLSNLPSDRRER
jgi:hypothetical protein